MYNIQIGKYVNIESFIHSLNPFIKILSVILISIFCTFSIFISNIILLFIIFVIMYLSKVNIKNYLKSIFSIRYLMITIFIIDIIFKNNIYSVLNNVLKIVILMLNTSVLMFTTKINDINYGFSILLSPLKFFRVKIDKISIIITLSIKFIYVILDDSSRIILGFRSRGLDFKGSLKEKIDLLKMYFETLFVTIIKKADDISNLIELRGIDLQKLNNKVYSFKLRDYIYLVSLLVILIIKRVILCVI